MKNSTLIKGTAAVAVGAALLLGGGGTLASWNDTATATPGSIFSGNLDIEPGAASWYVDGTRIDDISTYRVVPGDVLTFTQVLDVTLAGDKMAASVSASNINPANGFGDTVKVTGPKLEVDGVEVANFLKTSKTVTATITFEFLSATSGQTAVNETYNFNGVTFTLAQEIPAAAATQP